MRILIAGLPSSRPEQFEGKRRRSMLIVQGRFLQPSMGFDDLVTGQEFSRIRQLPHAWILNSVIYAIAHVVSPSLRADLGPSPSLLMPVVAGTNILHVAEPGGEPGLDDEPAEDCRLLRPDGALADAEGNALAPDLRRAFFNDPANREGHFFPTDLVFTFYIYQHVVDVSTYQLKVLRTSWELTWYLDGQPLQLMMRDASTGEYLFKYLMWHEKLLEDARAAERRALAVEQ